MDSVSSEDASVFPDEIITEILSWLPVIYLVKFRCVCKHWNSLFFNPAFIKLHLQRFPKNTQTLLTFVQPRGSINMETYAICSKLRLFESPASAIEECNPGYRCRHQQNVVGVCNGLACLIHSQVWSGHSRHLFVYLNPATRIRSPSPAMVVNRTRYYFLVEMAYMKYGFGYDDSIDTYKVVVMLMDRKFKNWSIKVHCLGDASWTHALTCPLFPIVGDDGRGLFAGGNVYWLAIKTPTFNWELRHLTISCSDGWESLISHYDTWEEQIADDLEIFSYDIKANTFKHLSMPRDLSHVHTHEPRLGVLKGCLSLSNDYGNGLDVWIMRETGNEDSWTKVLNLSYDDSHIGAPCPTRPLCVSEDEEIFLLINNRNDIFVVFNNGENRIDFTEDFTENKSEFISYDYTESLVLPYRN